MPWLKAAVARGQCDLFAALRFHEGTLTTMPVAGLDFALTGEAVANLAFHLSSRPVTGRWSIPARRTGGRAGATPPQACSMLIR